MNLIIRTLISKLQIHYETDSANDVWGKLFKAFLESPFYRVPAFYIIKRKAEIEINSPINITIETTNHCNANCIMCPHEKMKRKKGVMSDEIFNLILKRINDEKIPIDYIWMSGFGEPLIDSKIFDRLKILKQNGYRTKISTNGSLLKSDKVEELIKSGLDEINISFNGANKKDYEKVMKNLQYDRTLSNIHLLIRRRREKNLNRPIINISSVLTSQNEEKVASHISNWKNLVDSVKVGQVHRWGNHEKMSSGIETKLTNHIFPCRSLWISIVIAWNGDVIPCCVDYEGKIKLGNIKNNSLKEIWRGKEISEIRTAHLKRSLDNLPKICQNCNIPFRHGLAWFLQK